GVPLGPLAVGRAGLIATPLQMAMVASAVAGGGTLMTPHLDRRTPSVQSRVMTPATARALTAMLRGVVTSGTGTPADLRGGRIAGKTATVPLSTRRDGVTDVWFVGFAPADHPTVAVAVALELKHGGFGGTSAAPIAARVIASLLASGGHAGIGG
nr:penicillin-binding transpeptidase domain-containing protein [Actinomycetota bacterium]